MEPDIALLAHLNSGIIHIHPEFAILGIAFFAAILFFLLKEKTKL
jgi:hypothetical protein